MIVETQALTTIGIGAAKTQTEPGDVTIRIPNIILPTMEMIEPLELFPLAAKVMAVSFARHFFLSKTNDAGGSTTIATLGRGYWKLRVRFTMRSSYVAPITMGTNSFTVVLITPPGALSANLLSLNPIQSEVREAIFDGRMLLRDTAQILVTWGGTTVADFIDINTEVFAERLL